MKKHHHLFFIGLFFLLITDTSFAQKPVLTDKEIVTETVTKEMDELFKSKDFLKQKNKNCCRYRNNCGRCRNNSKRQSFHAFKSR